MFDTFVTVVGNVLHPPEQRQTSNTGAQVTTFKIASTARRMDRQTGKWIDGNSLRVRVTCWRALGSNVKQSVQVGDPVVVHGRLFTRDWTDDAGNKRTAYELEAMSLGHDLNRGRAVFERVKQRSTTSAIEDTESEQRVGGEATEPVPEHEADQFDETSFEAIFDRPAAFAPDQAAAPAADGADAAEGAETAEPGEPADESAGGPVGEPTPEDESDPADESGTGRRRGLRRAKAPA